MKYKMIAFFLITYLLSFNQDLGTFEGTLSTNKLQLVNCSGDERYKQCCERISIHVS